MSHCDSLVFLWNIGSQHIYYRDGTSKQQNVVHETLHHKEAFSDTILLFREESVSATREHSKYMQNKALNLSHSEACK